MTIPEQQREVALFLQRQTGSPASETHISAVFAGPRDVYKLKKAVKLSFLDFSDFASRATMAHRELTLNKMAAPEIYRDVQAIVRGGDGALQWAPGDTPHALDYVVHMARIPHGDFLDDITKRGDLTTKLMDALGDCVANLHASLPPVANWDSAGGMRHIIDGNVVVARQAGLPPAMITRWQQKITAELDRIAPALAARAKSGSVRRLHGDLHLGNICLWRGRPTAFDMLEFDEALATADVAYDLAFLLMDLEFHAGRTAANRVMNRYIARTGDVALLMPLPCFISIRAIVRAHVQAARAAPDSAARYLRVATDSLQHVDQVLVAIGGLQGAGKTTLARQLAPQLGRQPGAVLLRSDETRKRLFNAMPEEKLGANAYTAGANAQVNAQLLADVATGLKAGQAVIADSTFLHPPLRHAISRAAHEAGVEFHGFWLQADLDVLLQRVAARRDDASDAGPEVLREAAALDAGHITWRRVPVADMDAALATICRELPIQQRSAPAPGGPHIQPEQRSDGDAGNHG